MLHVYVNLLIVLVAGSALINALARRPMLNGFGIATAVIGALLAGRIALAPLFSYDVSLRYEFLSALWPLTLGTFACLMQQYYRKKIVMEQTFRAAQQSEAEARLQVERERSVLRVRSQQLADLAETGQMTSCFNHELSNALTPLERSLNRLSAVAGEDAKLAQPVEAVQRNVAALYDLLGQMKKISSVLTLEFKRVDLLELLQEIVLEIQKLPLAQGVRISTRCNTNATFCQADRPWLGRVVFNLLKNACEALQGRSAPQVIVNVTTVETLFKIAIEDNGPGMDDETLKRLFQYFFTTKGRQGTGLGLALSRKVIQGHGGTLEVSSQLSAGTTFTILIPREQSRCLRIQS